MNIVFKLYFSHNFFKVKMDQKGAVKRPFVFVIVFNVF